MKKFTPVFHPMPSFSGMCANRCLPFIQETPSSAHFLTPVSWPFCLTLDRVDSYPRGKLTHPYIPAFAGGCHLPNGVLVTCAFIWLNQCNKCRAPQFIPLLLIPRRYYSGSKCVCMFNCILRQLTQVLVAATYLRVRPSRWIFI